MTLWWVPLAAQGSVMLVDEFHCHAKRGLGTFERWSHVVDSLLQASCVGFTLLFPATELFRGLWLALATISVLVVTKDEWVHTREASAFEHWLHALLFIIHPMVLVAVWTLWANPVPHVLEILFVSNIGFIFYQIARWLIPWKRLRSPT